MNSKVVIKKQKLTANRFNLPRGEQAPLLAKARRSTATVLPQRGRAPDRDSGKYLTRRITVDFEKANDVADVDAVGETTHQTGDQGGDSPDGIPSATVTDDANPSSGRDSPSSKDTKGTGDPSISPPSSSCCSNRGGIPIPAEPYAEEEDNNDDQGCWGGVAPLFGFAAAFTAPWAPGILGNILANLGVAGTAIGVFFIKKDTKALKKDLRTFQARYDDDQKKVAKFQAQYYEDQTNFQAQYNEDQKKVDEILVFLKKQQGQTGTQEE